MGRHGTKRRKPHHKNGGTYWSKKLKERTLEVIRRTALEVGQRNQERALRILQENKPNWVDHVTAGTLEQDKNGVDIVVATQRGRFLVDVKSSDRGVDEYYKKARQHSPFSFQKRIAIKVDPLVSDEEICGQVFGEILNRKKIKLEVLSTKPSQ